MQHCAMSVILNLAEHGVTRLQPVVIDAVERLVVAFHGHQLNDQAAQDDRGFKDAAQVHLQKNVSVDSSRPISDSYVQKGAGAGREWSINLNGHVVEVQRADHLIEGRGRVQGTRRTSALVGT